MPNPSTSTAALLQALQARLEALIPADRVGEDDRYQVAIGTRTATQGSRAVLLTGTGGRRKFGARSISDWESQLQIETWYVDHGPEAYLQALADAEQQVLDLYAWVVSAEGQALGLFEVQPEVATVSGDGEGELLVTRAVNLRFRGA